MRLRHLRLGRAELRQLLDGSRNAAAKLGELHVRLLFQRRKRALRGRQREPRLIVLRRRDAVELQEIGIAVERDLVPRDLRLFRRDIFQHARVIVLHRQERQPRLREIRLGIVECDVELLRVDAEQHLAGLDVLSLVHSNILDETGHVGRNH